MQPAGATGPEAALHRFGRGKKFSIAWPDFCEAASKDEAIKLRVLLGSGLPVVGSSREYCCPFALASPAKFPARCCGVATMEYVTSVAGLVRVYRSEEHTSELQSL